MSSPLLSVAPMVDWTDRHYRFFIRQLAPHSLLYTEMHTTGAILHGDPEQILDFDERERPLALQVAGDSPDQLAAAVAKAERWNYDEYNLNCGCPSDKVQEAHFGACLMGDPRLVARLVRAMKDSTNKPVTVKHRIGIRGHGISRETYEEMREFVEQSAAAGADRFIVHARIAILEGLDPKQNREIPPLRYEDVYRLKREFPSLTIEINGGFRSPEEIVRQFEFVDGVMIGRAAYEDPYMMAECERRVWDEPLDGVTRRRVVEAMIPYTQAWEERGLRPQKIFRHMTGLFAGFRGARRWRQLLSPPWTQPMTGAQRLARGLEAFSDEALDSLLLRPEALPPGHASATMGNGGVERGFLEVPGPVQKA